MTRSLVFLVTLVPTHFAIAATDRPPQFVLLAFDGSKNNNFWEESRQFAAANKIQFTYFVNGVYFLLDQDKNNYVEPNEGRGKSAIGWGGTDIEVLRRRLGHMKAAMEEGHEMASHGNGHYDGARYSFNQWDSEFTQFTDLMSGVWDRYDNSNEPAGWKDYFANEVVGFRAPQLGVGPGLWGALEKHKFQYDTSRVDRMNYWPRRVDGVWNFPLASINIVNGDGTPVYKKNKKGETVPATTLSMDYNFYFYHSNGVEGSASNFGHYEGQMFQSYMSYFRNNYYGNRAPVHIGHHFSKWNGSAYWNAMHTFAQIVCSEPEVICGTYKDLLSFVEANEDRLKDFQDQNFNIVAKRKKIRALPYISDEQIEELRAMQNDHFNAHED